MLAEAFMPLQLRVLPSISVLVFDLKNNIDDGTFDLFPFTSLSLPAAPCFDSLDYPLDQKAGDEMWAYSLVPQKLRVGAPGDGTLEMRYKLNLYSPQFVARQFGFAQALPFLSAPVSKKTKGTHINDILSFEKFYKVKWNVVWLRQTFYSTLDIWKRKKTAHEDRCFRNYLKAKQIDPLARLECFVKPSKYPPFPNAEFCIADRLPDPWPNLLLLKEQLPNPPSLQRTGFQNPNILPKRRKRKKGVLEQSLQAQRSLRPESGIPLSVHPTLKALLLKWLIHNSLRKSRRKLECRGSLQGSKQQIHPNRQLSLTWREPDAMFNRSVSAGLAGVSSSQASTESTRVEYTPLGHETIPVFASTSCPADTSIIAASSSDLALFKPEMSLISHIKEGAIDEEGPFVVPTPEAGDLDFADDEFNFDSILSEAQGVFFTAVPVASSGKLETERLFPSDDGRGHVPPQNLPEQSTIDRATIIEKENKVLGCLNYSLEETVASSEVKSQLLEATTFLSQHASSEASSLESFMEDLYNSNVLLESSSADLRVVKDDLSKHKKNMAKYGAALLKVKPLSRHGVHQRTRGKIARKNTTIAC
ncbi:hypothetical protein PIB30_086640 [Stylosanthes scabra]|uniref:Uncharacterized protein n=1 Tax=Stylosanthes scabra TaxID=79078 RepID=A0ABU6TSN7_9FABA|nr:hypothetical protein [Stylosanthes scabra]